ncbi:MAG: PQQ-binding-like beta-propeller repeat protein [Acidobacteriota bacterium]|nr:PQQ-binding-like beta-propeller repeat protein [Acidobacteriota bacterium]
MKTVPIVMLRTTHRVVAATTVCVLGFSGASLGQDPDPGRDLAAEDWPLAGGDWTSSRYSTLTDINTVTIDRLSGAWVTRLEGGASSRATPVVKDGVIYLTAGASVLAIDGGTGETVWRWEAENPETQMVPSWQGVGLSDDLVFVGLRSVQVAALRQDTGELVWAETVGSVPEVAGETVTTAPIHASGKVFVGVANGDSGGQGRVVALDASTGEIAWTFFVVPRPGEFGHETWPQDSDIWEVGGGGVWLVGTVDPDLRSVYFATGNPVPMFGGEIRGGDNLFTASVLALDIETGERRWHYQVVRHDIWDADIATPMLLYDVEVDGQIRKGVAAMRADGFLFLFDRETGEPLVPIEERPVPQDPGQLTAATQPFPVDGERIIPDCSYWRDRVPPPFELSCSFFTPPSADQQTVVALGAPIPMVRVTPMSFSPQTGLIYAQGRGHVGRAKRFEDPWISDNRPGGYLRLGLPESAGVLAAVDPRTNRVVWKQELTGGRLATSGPLTTAGGLVFWGSADGQLDAYHAETGERLWAFQATPVGARMRPGPTASYAFEDRQYIAMPMGNELWAFALDGTVPPRDEPSAEPLSDLVRWTGPAPRDTDQIETGTLRENPSWSLGGSRSAIDEHAFGPQRVRVTVGTRVRFINNGEIPHTVEARDGSWATGAIEPGLFEYVAFDTPGLFMFHCADHPWALGEITVER